MLLFLKGKRQGKGSIKFATGEEATGKWINGALVNSDEGGVVKNE